MCDVYKKNVFLGTHLRVHHTSTQISEFATCTRKLVGARGRGKIFKTDTDLNVHYRIRHTNTHTPTAIAIINTMSHFNNYKNQHPTTYKVSR